MNTFNIFSPFYTRVSLGVDHDKIKSSILDNIVENYNTHPNLSPDWNVHTSYGMHDFLKNKIDWSICKEIYTKHIDVFLLSFFGKKLEWEFCGDIWYTVYGSGQSANIHDHIPDVFSFVHFLKFDPKEHWPVSFINPNGGYVKLLLDKYESLKNNIDFNNQNQSLFHPRFTPYVEEGDLIIFPSSLEHMVEKTNSEELRITIAFNIKLK